MNEMLQHVSINKHLQSSNAHAKVITFAIYTSLMMAQDWAESTKVTISYGSSDVYIVL